MTTPQDFYTELVGRATEDPGFRARLLSNPRLTIEDEFERRTGQRIAIPADVEIHIHEDRPKTINLSLPQIADDLASDDLWDVEYLMQQSSSSSICGFCGTSCSGCGRTCVV
jgi:hypothetical protein